MNEIAEQQDGWVLYQLPPSRFVLSVRCGAGLSELVNIELSFESRQHYLIAGTVYLEYLADKIQSNPERFRKHHVELPAT